MSVRGRVSATGSGRTLVHSKTAKNMLCNMKTYSVPETVVCPLRFFSFLMVSPGVGITIGDDQNKIQPGYDEGDY